VVGPPARSRSSGVAAADRHHLRQRGWKGSGGSRAGRQLAAHGIDHRAAVGIELGRGGEQGCAVRVRRRGEQALGLGSSTIDPDTSLRRDASVAH